MDDNTSSLSIGPKGIICVEDAVSPWKLSNRVEDESPNKNKGRSTNKMHVTFSIQAEDQTEGHSNAIFNSADESSPWQSVVARFGGKGKQKGEYQDAKELIILPHNRILITDMINNRLQLCSDRGRPLGIIDGDDVMEPWGATLTSEKHVAVSFCRDRCVKIFDDDGNLIRIHGQNFFKCPNGITIDRSGRFIVCDSVANTVSIHDQEFNLVRYLGNSDVNVQRFSKPRYVCVSVNGDIIVSDSGNHCIKIFNSNGDFVRSFGSFGNSSKQFKYPYGVCTNMLGEIFVADHYNNRISMFSRDGIFIRHLVTSDMGLKHPQGLAISSDRRLYVTHGNLKSSEIIIFSLNYGGQFETSEYLSYV